MKVVALAGGVGGAKMAEGLSLALSPEDLTVIVNVGDDFDHLGLRICPDLDTVCYTLAGLANQETGWGRSEDTFYALQSITELGGPGWFQLGDQDIGLHLERTRRLRLGETLSHITRSICQVWGVKPVVLPVCDQALPTVVLTAEGSLPFQDYFVRQQCQPVVTGFQFIGAENAVPARGVLEAIALADLVVICPSNPWVSIDPILAVSGIQAALANKSIIAISPLIGGRAVKGPAAKMYRELGYDPSALEVARHYQRLVRGFVLDLIDDEWVIELNSLGMEVLCTEILMKSMADRRRLAREVLEFGSSLVKKE